MTRQFDSLEIDWDTRTVEVEYSLIEGKARDRDLIVFLHEGLGSLSLWKDFPARLCADTGCSGLVYSRPGYGRSTPFDSDEFWNTNFMHQQAYDVLPKVLAGLNIDLENNSIWLFGHSDGASIALLYSAAHPVQVEGLIVVAPHIIVEDKTINSIRRLVKNYRKSDLKHRFATHHLEPDLTFFGWSRVWLDRKFRSWSIRSELQRIKAPVLAIQGTEDEYGTAQQIDGIQVELPESETYWITGCGHAPHRTHQEKLLTRSVQFIRENRIKCES